MNFSVIDRFDVLSQNTNGVTFNLSGVKAFCGGTVGS